MKNAFRVIGILEGLSYILLLLIAVPIKYIGGDASYVKMLGLPHGLLFMAYLIFAVMLRYEVPWKSKIFWIIILASLIPFGTFYTDKKYLRN